MSSFRGKATPPMLARLKSIALFGIEACPLEVEVDVA
jgi:hypothetical protein